MRSIWERIRNDIRSYRGAALALLAYAVVMRLLFRAFCPLVIVSGLPCPGCGLSRAVWLLLTGQLARSFALHPLAAGWLLAAVWFSFDRYVTGRGMTKGFLCLLGLLAAATVLLYVYRMLRLFPDMPPVSYTDHNLLERWIPGYRGRLVAFFGLCTDRLCAMIEQIGLS